MAYLIAVPAFGMGFLLVYMYTGGACRHVLSLHENNEIRMCRIDFLLNLRYFYLSKIVFILYMHVLLNVYQMHLHLNFR